MDAGFLPVAASVSWRVCAAVPGGAAQALAVSLRSHRCRSGSLRRCRPRAAHPLPLVQWQCRGALKSAVNTHESGAGGKGFPLLQSLSGCSQALFQRGCFSGRGLGLLAEGSNPTRRVWFGFQLLPLETAVNGGESSGRARSPAPKRGDVAL